MTIRNIILLIMIMSFICPFSVKATDEIILPRPVMKGGMPLMEALALRQSSREFAEDKLPIQMMSNLLWAAWGINRQDTGKRTAPSSRNCQDIDVYVALEEGIYLYDAKSHSLKLTIKGDNREFTGKQDFVKTAPVNLIYVSNLDRIKDKEHEAKLITAGNDTAFIGQNVYLFCTSSGLATVIRAYIDIPLLSEKMKLNKDQRIILCQTVGFPKKK